MEEENEESGASTKDEQTETETDSDYKRIAVKDVVFLLDLIYIKSRLGIFNAVEVTLSFLCLMFMRGGYPVRCARNQGTYSFYDWAVGSVFFTRFVLYLVFAVSIEGIHCPKIVPWLHIRVFVLGIFSAFCFASSVILIAGLCGHGVFVVAMLFGFALSAVLMTDLFFSFREIRKQGRNQDESGSRHSSRDQPTFMVEVV